ncbi:putative glycosyl transferase family 2 protein [Selenomonas ruminantium subsp. lactilytica TAM6421]|uniref:Putative glycosyl transferase family 2 protein n=1 Tax=Selenomonas ruminantium subsp. lactilytica (strain NBRC 103574 / TAM6421) TaxID=927704 RepID=I0GTI0_SELRL|nr:glycosyltransferase [Selenomonas ruminantium]BAL84067.1 putative glycosyl transferase family 2 protein [Selenomonas ruminantium subsp. lactilytica TAM6421]
MKGYVKISIIVPIFNAEKYLSRCLNSLIGQTLKEIEIICVDDASTDGSTAIVQQYAARDERVKLFYSSGNEVPSRNLGQSIARNIGLVVASGEYILMVDADDWLELDAAKKLYELSTKDRLDILYFGFVFEYEDDKIRQKEKGMVVRTRAGACIDKAINGQEMFVLQLRNNAQLGVVWAAVFKREFLHDSRLFFNEELRFEEDCLFSLQAILRADRTKCIDVPLYHYYRRHASVTTDVFTEKYLMDKFIQACYAMKEVLYQKNILPDNMECISRWLGGHFSLVHRIWNDNFNIIDGGKIVFLRPWENIALEVFKCIVRPEPSLHKFTDEELCLMKNCNTVIVYGAGYVAGRTLIYLHNLGIDKFKIAVTNKTNNYFMGNEICDINELCRKSPNNVVLLAVMPDKQIEMINVLKLLGNQTYICMV